MSISKGSYLIVSLLQTTKPAHFAPVSRRSSLLAVFTNPSGHLYAINNHRQNNLLCTVFNPRTSISDQQLNTSIKNARVNFQLQ